ncbi:urease accessory protein UreD [Methylobacterium aerolatum]|uniref:Urease accessory protein UreD n=1 Tax=Methylobacterium aerolatum TaxID=418708 RepID=A0ABU0I5F8_9HYPH|nr:urease accessory protein UreD [Methylobacterium aerolatum]MDQ0448859.1 urease accessory protein [Methylobacterium aerolatum]GJD34223.1 Urease accessory protein UreD [Methylobacterium aerolatum]
MHTKEAIPGPDTAPPRQRSTGTLRLTVGPAGEGGPTRLRDLAESGPSRLRFPKAGAVPEAVLVNTAGGIACGDSFTVDLDLAPGSALVFTTTAAEKIYRSDGPDSTIDNRVVLGEGARLAWVPQETILFDRARLRRSFAVDLAEGAGLLALEIVAFGRAARRERIAEGLFVDRWQVRRAGRLVYADTVRLDGPISDRLARRAIGGGAGAAATFLDASPGAEGRLEEARHLLEAAGLAGGGPSGEGAEAAASAWNGHLAVRCLGPAIGPLREGLARFVAAYRGEAMPRVWQT